MEKLLSPLMLFHFALVVLLSFAAMQDCLTREISNWFTLPIFAGGVVLLISSGDILFIILSVVLYFFWHYGFMGGADAKVLIGLLGLWGNAALLSFFILGIWGVVLLLKKKKESFPGLVAISFGSSLTFIINVSIMLLN